MGIFGWLARKKNVGDTLRELKSQFKFLNKEYSKKVEKSGYSRFTDSQSRLNELRDIISVEDSLMTEARRKFERDVDNWRSNIEKESKFLNENSKADFEKLNSDFVELSNVMANIIRVLDEQKKFFSQPDEVIDKNKKLFSNLLKEELSLISSENALSVIDYSDPLLDSIDNSIRTYKKLRKAR
jgi:hypothetical protein